MNSIFHDFTWSVPSAGYRWANLAVSSSAGRPVRVLVEGGEPGVGHYRRYDPLVTNPALFRDFAVLPPTEAAFLGFANKWGSIGEADVIVNDATLAGRPAELFDAWLRSVSEMRQAVWIWNRLASKSVEEQRLLLRHVRWESDPDGHTSVIFDSHPHLPPRQSVGDDGYFRVASVIASDHFGDEGLARFQRGEVSQPAREFLGRLVNAALRRRASTQVFPDEGPAVLKEAKRLPVLFSLRVVPSNLYATLWLQLAMVMTSDKEQRQCPGCGAWFEVRVKGEFAARGVRADKTYCRPACRTRAYRVKRDHAVRLRAEGKKPKEIAKEIGVDVSLVQKWTSKKRG